MNDDALKMKYDHFFKIKNNIIIGNLPSIFLLNYFLSG